MAACGRCGRPLAVNRPTCLYCGAPVTAAPAPPAPTAVPDAQGPERVLLVAVLEGADPGALAGALGLSLTEARQRVRRTGPELLRIRAADGAAEECARLEACGATVRALPETPVRRAADPWLALGGRPVAGGLRLRGGAGERLVAPEALLLVVEGRIQREYQPREGKRPRTATLEQGHRLHLHLRDEEVPVELDPGGFEFDEDGGPISSLLRLRGWVERLSEGVPRDDGFRFVPPALGPEEPAGAGALAATGGLRRSDRAEESLVLDNLRQFRFYSAWRGAWARAAAR